MWFHIAAGSLSETMRAVAERADLEAGMNSDDADGVYTNGIQGYMSALAAYCHLLNGTGLTFGFFDEVVYVVREPSDLAPPLSEVCASFIEPSITTPSPGKTPRRVPQPHRTDLHRACTCVNLPQAAWCWEGDAIKYEPSCRGALAEK